MVQFCLCFRLIRFAQRQEQRTKRQQQKVRERDAATESLTSLEPTDDSYSLNDELPTGCRVAEWQYLHLGHHLRLLIGHWRRVG